MNIQALYDIALSTVQNHKLGPGSYARYLWQDAANSLEMGCNPYGCADAANILYSLARFPGEPEERAASISVLQSMQDPSDGFFHEHTHHPIHTTAHCTAALELFEARPAHPIHSLQYLTDPNEIAPFLEKLDWKNNPWPQSHQGAGMYAAMKLCGMVDDLWEDTYFSWMWEHSDPEIGFIGGHAAPGVAPDEAFDFWGTLAGSFHYFFNHEYAKRPFRYPERVIDSCLTIRSENIYPDLGRKINFAEIDWVYCMTRSMRKTPYRHDDCMKALRGFASEYFDFCMSLDHERDFFWNDLHSLFGAVCCFAELQQALPGEVRTSTPLRLVLDRRPFI